MLPMIFGYEYDYYEYQTLELHNTITSDLSILPTDSNFNVDFAEIELKWFPREDFRQNIVSFQTDPETLQKKGLLVFSYHSPVPTKIGVVVDTILRTSGEYLPVYEKIEFPILEFESELAPYIDFYEITDVNQDIYDLANTLAEGKDDLFEVVFSFADWVEKNIDYNLNSVTEEASQPSSWVLQNKYGVCDEISTLFISLNRAVGIPARFVSGVAYTNIEEFENQWGPHGWAEVYFPEIGWIPFDVTYGQLGWVDATHIKMQDSVDSSVESVAYNAEGKSFELKSGTPNSQVEVSYKANVKTQPNTEIKVSVTKSFTGFGSYNLIIADIKNLKNHYVIEHIQLAPSESVENLDDTKRTVLLRPGETKKEIFLVKVFDDLSSGYTYTFTAKIYAEKYSSETSYQVRQESMIYNKNYFKITETSPDEEQKFVQIRCDDTRKAILINQTFEIKCKFVNLLNKDTMINICLQDNCKYYEFKAQEVKEVALQQNMDKLGVWNVEIRALNNKFSASTYILVNVIPNSTIKITGIEYPAEVRIKDNINISFTISKNAYSNPTGIIINFKGDVLFEEWTVDLKSDTEFKFSIPTYLLKPGENEYRITVKYNNDLGQPQVTEQNFKIFLVDVNFWNRIKIFFLRISTSIN